MQTQKVARWWKVEEEDIIRYVDKGEVLGFARSFREDLPALGKLSRKSASTEYEDTTKKSNGIFDR